MPNTDVNAPRWRRGLTGHYEVWGTSFNHRPSRTGGVIHYGLHSPKAGHGQPSCSLAFSFFDAIQGGNNLALLQRFDVQRLALQDAPLRIAIDAGELTADRIRGNLPQTKKTPAVRWDLNYRSSSFPHLPLPEFGYHSALVASKSLTPNPAIYLSGTVAVGERELQLDQSPGGQYHAWGNARRSAWTRVHCCAFREEPTAALELYSVRTNLGPLRTPPLTFVALYLGGEVYRFRDITQAALIRADWAPNSIRFIATGRTIRLEGEIAARTEQLIAADEQAPNGRTVSRQLTQIASAKVLLHSRRSPIAPFREVCRLSCANAVHFERGGAPTPDPPSTRQRIISDAAQTAESAD